MENTERSLRPLAPPGFVLAPIHGHSESQPLRVCVLVRAEPEPKGGRFILLRELPGARVYLGAICDADARIQEWLEIWVQNVDLRDVAFSGSQESLTNHNFDQRWLAEYKTIRASRPDAIVVAGMETNNPAPILIKKAATKEGSGYLPVERAPWELCKDDALLDSFGLPRYSSSPFRYLHQPESTGAKTFLATAPDAPTNSHVQGLERLKSNEIAEIFNPHAGLIRVTRFSPLGLEEFLQILEGRPWEGLGLEGARLFAGSLYADLQSWSANPKGMPFLLHGAANSADRLNEIFFLKLAALRDLFKEVRIYVKAQQLPLLNLSPASFQVRLQEVGDQFPALWSAKCSLVKPGQAHPLKIKSTEQKYFIRLGRIEPSPFLPEGLGAHSFGSGSVRLRKVLPETDGTVLEGTLVAEDYLSLDPYDLLWFRLPLGEERLEFYAHVYTAEAVGPKEARFRTVPAKLPDAIVNTLKASLTNYPRSPYEIWPLLSSPCDLHSLGILAIRILLANSQSNLPVIVDDVLGLARHLGKDPEVREELVPRLKALLERDRKLLDVVSPHALTESERTPEQARAQIHLGLWLEAVALLLRLFPGAGSQSYCANFGDVPPLAIETVFDRPLQELEALLLRLRTVLAPGLSANEEIVGVLLKELAAS